MDTSQIKRFAVDARNILKQGVINRITALGFNDKGEVEERNKPQRLQGNTLFMGQLYDENFYGKWMALYNRVQTKGIKEVYEEAAYTWFNRLMAIRIMEKNSFTDPVLSFDDDRLRIPRIVSNARAGQVYVSDESDREKLSELLMDDTKTTEQFTLLITAFCHSNPVINNCFGGVSDYTEILLPTNILSEGGFVDLLNHTAFITDDDYRQSELIGWLYQFYISEKKDEVFASFKGGRKAEAEDIPAATQIFTPNWIVKYMVQNTVGRIYLNNNPDSDLKENWKYLVEPSTPTPDDCIFKCDDPKELTMADLGCGSGHILNEGFDILYDIYIEEGYSRKQAVENIFKYNLTGVDLDTRAKQLATFALMMKACQKDDSFLDCHVMPNVLDMPDVDRYSFIEADGHFCCEYSLDWDNEQKNKIHLELVTAFELLKQAHNLGSIMKFDLSNSTIKYIKRCVEVYEEDPKFQNPFATLIHAYKLILALTQKYASLVMNPPYMGNHNMNDLLKKYIDKEYCLTSNDLGTVFLDVCFERISRGGKYSMINQSTWLFKKAYEPYRKWLINDSTICFDSLLYLGAGTFDEIKGEVVQSVCFASSNVGRSKTEFFYLKNKTTSSEKKEVFLSGKSLHFSKIISIFNNFKGYQFGFWIPEEIISLFSNSTLSTIGCAKQGLKTGNNPYFIRNWSEVSFNKIGSKWFPIETGGDFRKWYGNHFDVINWENEGYEIKNYKNKEGKLRSRPQSLSYMFKEGLTWSTSASDKQSFRYSSADFLFESSGSKFFSTDGNHDVISIMGYLNSVVCREFVEIFAPGLGISEGAINSLPYLETADEFYSDVNENIEISRADWDAHETSWDFETNELLKIEDDVYRTFIDAYEDEIRERYGRIEGDGYLLEALVECYKEKWEENFRQLHQNEEELNRQFIEIYGLQDELTPDVPMEEITILQQGEISIENND